MPWPPRVRDRSEIADAELEYYDGVWERASKGVGKHYMQLMASPAMTFHLSQIGKQARQAGERGDSFTHAAREWIDQVLSVDLKTNMLWGLHFPDGIAAGVRLEAVEALREGREEDLTDDERQLTDFIRGILAGTVTPEAWEAMEQRFGERGVVEYSILIVYIFSNIRLRQAIEDVRYFNNEEVDALIQSIKSGAQEVPDYRLRIG